MTRCSHPGHNHHVHDNPIIEIFLADCLWGFGRILWGGLSSPPIQGVCQGNGTGPAIWLAVSMCIVQMVHTHGFPTTITSAISSQQFTLAGFLYVDDMDLFYMPSGSTTSSLEVIDCLQQHYQFGSRVCMPLVVL